MKVLQPLVLLFVLNLSSLLLAQTTVYISVVVTDPSGAVVSGVNVTATNTASNAARSTTSNTSGFYSITNLDPGRYRVVVEKEGFKSYKFGDFERTVAQALTLNANLTLSNPLDSRTMTDLPLLTRNAYEFVLLSPEVIEANDGEGGSGGFSANGSRDRNNNFLLNGVDNNDTSVPGAPNGIIAINPDSARNSASLPTISISSTAATPTPSSMFVTRSARNDACSYCATNTSGKRSG